MSGSNDRAERWAGGYVRVVGEGPTRQRVYVIRKMVSGTRYEVSTHRGNETDALLELQKFQKSPATYDPSPPPDLLGDQGPEPIYLDAKLIREHLDYSTKLGTSRVWWLSKKRLLSWWLEKLHGIDLRKADLKRDILKPLEGATSRQHRIAVIKHLYSWLRDAENGKGLLTASEDPTLSALKVPQNAPVQYRRRRAFSLKDLAKVKLELTKGPSWRLDAVTVLAGTGWHYTELCRFADAGEVEALPGSQRGKGKKGEAAGAGVLVTKHKGGSVHKTAVSAEVLAAAKRLRAKGHLPEFHLFRVLRHVSKKLKLKVPVTAGSFRHTVATEAIEQGATPEQVSAFLGHKSPQTTKRFYATLSVAPKIPTLS